MVRKETGGKKPRRPATTPEARENQMISLAMDLAEEQLRNGTASAQVITHFLKLGSIREEMERDLLSRRTDFLGAKTESIESAQRIEELYSEAIAAMRRYSGSGDEII